MICRFCLILLILVSILFLPSCGDRRPVLPEKGQSFLDIAFAEEVVDHETPIEEILAFPEKHNPVTLCVLASWLHDQGRSEEAFFWFHLAQIRAYYDFERVGWKDKLKPTDGAFLRFGMDINPPFLLRNKDKAAEILSKIEEWDSTHLNSYSLDWIMKGKLKPLNWVNGEPAWREKSEWQQLKKQVRQSYIEDHRKTFGLKVVSNKDAQEPAGAVPGK